MTRISIKFRDPNPLYRTWLTEWVNQAEREGRETLATSFRNALSSLKKYPLPLKTPRECMILDGFGPKICDMLEKKQTKYRLIQSKSQPSTKLVEHKPVPVKAPVKDTLVVPVKVAPKLPSQSQDGQITSPGPSTSGAKKTIRKVKSDQALAKSATLRTDGEAPAPAPVKAATKRKATTPLDTIPSDDVIMSPGSFEVILLVDSMETVG